MRRRWVSFGLVAMFGLGALSLSVFGGEVTCSDGTKVDPFANNDGSVPPKDVYDGLLFELNHAYPTKAPPPPTNAPWRKALGGKPISKETAGAYADALKQAVSKNAKTLLFDYKSWNAAEAGWYNSPWLFPVRDAIHGSFVGNTFPPSMFPQSKLTATMTTHVVVYYDKTAAVQLHRLWGTEATAPSVNATDGQFPEGAIIVKPAYTTADAKVWPPMAGSPTWQIWSNTDSSGNSGKHTLQTVSLLQFDIIVKDSLTAPRTGWVFTTLVYDARIKSADPWDRMVPLGVAWGSDPTVISPVQAPSESWVDPRLQENWINPSAPAYSKETLGWGGRLSGPNDGAVNPAYVQDGDKFTLVPRAQCSSCMSCHSAAEYEPRSFLLPFKTDAQGNPISHGPNQLPVLETPGSPEWMAYFQSRYGTNGMNKGSYGMDYDMVFAFKAVRYWSKCVKPDVTAHPVHQHMDNYVKFRAHAARGHK